MCLCVRRTREDVCAFASISILALASPDPPKNSAYEIYLQFFTKNVKKRKMHKNDIIYSSSNGLCIL